MRTLKILLATMVITASALTFSPTARTAVADAFLRVAPFPTLVTRPAIEAAVSNFVESLRRWRKFENDYASDYARQHREALSMFANDSARFAVWDAQFISHLPDRHEGSNRVGCSYRYDGCFGRAREPKLARWRRDLSEAARAYLRDPNRLWALYIMHRDDVIVKINQLHAGAEVRRYLISVMTYFQGTPWRELRAAEAKYQQARQRAITAMKGCACAENWKLGIGDAEVDCNACATGQVELMAYRAAQAELARLVPDWVAFEWASRRRREGGERLRDAWGRIIHDIIERI